jgi:16S rRNA (cytosine1402-N4)-methyltransferase
VVSAFEHTSVLQAEVVEALRPRDGGRYVDGTLGGAGHAQAILQASAPGGWLFGCDLDSQAIESARHRLVEYGARVELRQGNYADLGQWVEAGSCDGVLLDLGVSSPQLDQPQRGFSFLRDGPLDMRMDRTRGRSAADLVNSLAAAELAEIFYKYGEERQARRIARAIDEERSRVPFRTTGQLAGLIERLSPRKGRRVHPATRIFQALRIVVNDELDSLERGLVAAVTALRAEGRLAVITFHSLEDRLVKQFGRSQALDYEVAGSVDIPELRRPRVPVVKWITRKPIEPGDRELEANPRSRSARLRVMEKL